MRKRFIGGILAVLFFLMLSVNTVSAGLVSDKNAYIYREDLFDSEYAGGYILINSIDSSSGMSPLNFNWNASCYVEGIGANNYGRKDAIYADHYNGACINGDKWHTQVFPKHFLHGFSLAFA